MEEFKQTDCFRRNLKLWKLLGIFPLTVSRPLLYEFYSKILISFFIILYSVLFTINLYFIPKYLDSYIEELIFYFTVLSIMGKVITFMLKKKKIKDLIDILESDIFQPESKEATVIIDESKRIIKIFWKIYTAVCITSNLVHVSSPLLNHFILKSELFLPVCSYSFIPENIRFTYIYTLYFYQSIGMHFHVLFTVNIDTFFVGLMVFLIAQLKILHYKFIHITDFLEEESKNFQNDAELILKLNKVLIHHGEITKFCSLIEDVFSVAVFVQFGMSSYIICMCLIRYTMPATWQYFIFLSTYTFAMVVQILIPCWFGTRIMDKSYQLSQSIYNCDWIPRSRRFNSSMRLFVERAQRPLSITGWKMFQLSLRTFASIMNGAYSFFNLLRHMQSR